MTRIVSTSSPGQAHGFIASVWAVRMRWIALPMAMATSLLAGGCATVRSPDPLEPVNRKIFAFNEGLDKAVLKPTSMAYKAVVPSPARAGISNFFSNLSDPWSAFNLVLQGRFKEALSDLGRFGTNTTVGVLGLVDFASGWGMPRHGEEFGRTLGSWGVGTGAYLVLPVLGPSTLRDTAALPVNSLGTPLGHVDAVPLRNSLIALNVVSLRAELIDAGNLLDEIALDKYLFVRDAHLQRRRQLPPSGARVQSDMPAAGELDGQGETALQAGIAN